MHIKSKRGGRYWSGSCRDDCEAFIAWQVSLSMGSMTKRFVVHLVEQISDTDVVPA